MTDYSHYLVQARQLLTELEMALSIKQWEKAVLTAEKLQLSVWEVEQWARRK